LGVAFFLLALGLFSARALRRRREALLMVVRRSSANAKSRLHVKQQVAARRTNSKSCSLRPKDGRCRRCSARQVSTAIRQKLALTAMKPAFADNG